MANPPMRIPPGPAEKYETDQDLLCFMEENFARYGDIYKASIYGGTRDVSLTVLKITLTALFGEDYRGRPATRA